ncbi:MAG: site-specific DNA-methyltransferase, partial [Calditrichaeota bacterium]|nr:site-specific DNA-methyltransferase [Calditrichota bacterium]
AMMTVRLLELHRILKSTGTICLHCDATAGHYLRVIMDTIFDVRNHISDIIWAYGTPSGGRTAGKRPIKNHDILITFAKAYSHHTYNRIYLPYDEKYIRERFNKVDESGRRYRERERNEVFTRQYLDESPGVPLSDIWTDLKQLYAYHWMKRKQEELGYPTQKPLALLERVVSMSSNPGDIVLDPFCGCGTALHAAQKLGRRWLGMDITYLAINLIERRMRDAFPDLELKVIGEPRDLASAHDLARRDKWQFQWWALTKINAQPVRGKKTKGADKGIDGVIPFFDGPEEEYRRAIISVKGGEGIHSSDIRDLVGVLDREKSPIGILVTLFPPTKPMITEAATAGLWMSEIWGRKFHRIQILSIEEILNGKKPDLPWGKSPFAKAPVESNTTNQLEF